MSSHKPGILKRIFRTVPDDKEHFPSTNQAHHCWQKYNEYVLCLKKNNHDEDACIFARYEANAICPEFWMEEWDDQRARGVFLGVQEYAPVEPHDSSHKPSSGHGAAGGAAAGKHH